MKDAILSHIIENRRDLALEPDDDRISVIRQDVWIGYQGAQAALDRLTDLLEHPKIGRMPNLLLVGASGSGKSTILQKFVRSHPIGRDDFGQIFVPVVMMSMPSAPTEVRFWSELLFEMQVGSHSADGVQRLRRRAVDTLIGTSCRMLIIDEFHNVLSGTAREQRLFLTLIKNLSNELKIPIVCAGIREAIRALHTDTQLSSRFEALGLARWKLDRNFLSFLATYETVLPLRKASNLASREIAMEIFSRTSGGILGEIVILIKDAAVEAVRSKEEQITLKVLRRVKRVSLQDYGKLADQF